MFIKHGSELEKRVQVCLVGKTELMFRFAIGLFCVIDAKMIPRLSFGTGFEDYTLSRPNTIIIYIAKFTHHHIHGEIYTSSYL